MAVWRAERVITVILLIGSVLCFLASIGAWRLAMYYSGKLSTDGEMFIAIVICPSVVVLAPFFGFIMIFNIGQ